MASHAVAIPPTPMTGKPGSDVATSLTMRTATGWIAGPDSPPVPAPRAAAPVCVVVRQAEQRVDARHRLGAGLPDGDGDLDTRSVFGLNLAHTGRPAAAATVLTTSAESAGSWAKIPHRAAGPGGARD